MKLDILAHRGHWSSPAAKNSPQALGSALKRGWGIELDIRDRNGTMVISHDMADDRSVIFEEFLSGLTDQERLPCFAINIKADGLAAAVNEVLRRHRIENFFVFDMSVPDTRTYLDAGMPVYSRMSEEEPCPAFASKAKGIWLDSFTAAGADIAAFRTFLEAGHSSVTHCAIVSPELHNRPHEQKWHELRNAIPTLMDTFGISFAFCTDKPEEATVYFGESDD